MDYICVKTKTIEGIDGQFKLKKGNHAVRIGDYLYKDGKRICVWRSQTAKELFFLNDDGKGLEKSAKLNEIREKIGELLEASQELHNALDTEGMTEEEAMKAHEELDDPNKAKLDGLSKLDCFANLDAPYQATLEELEEAYSLLV